MRGYGTYADNTSFITNITCQLDPLFTINTVTFDGFVNRSLTVGVVRGASFPAVPNSNTTLIRDITMALTTSLLDGQSGSGNTFVDFLAGLIDVYPVDAKTLIPIMFVNMFEISGLAVNGYWSSKLFANSTPAEPFSRHVDGTISYPVYGWKGDAKAIAGLIPFTLVVIIGLLMVLWSYHQVSDRHFEPSGRCSI